MNTVWDNWLIFAVPITSLLITLLCMPLIRSLASYWRCVALPNENRSHSRPTPILGGVASYAGFLVSILVFSPSFASALPFLLIVTLMFLVGIYDDLRRLNPATKLVGQIATAAVAIYFGHRLSFFGWPPLDALLTAVWIVGLTNVVNLLDNMDGLAGGIGLIAALYLALLFHQQGDVTYAVITLAIASAVGGFLFHNFYPASLFMGDAGSLFLGAALSLLTVQANGQASNILSLVAVPTCILLVPILDTTLVTVTRLLRGQPVSQGGRDHTSHRLVTLGLSEPQAVLLLYVMAVVAGATATFIKGYSYGLSLAILPLVLIAFTLFTAYLAQVEVVSAKEPESRDTKKRTIPLPGETYKRRGEAREVMTEHRNPAAFQRESTRKLNGWEKSIIGIAAQLFPEEISEECSGDLAEALSELAGHRHIRALPVAIGWLWQFFFAAVRFRSRELLLYIRKKMIA